MEEADPLTFDVGEVVVIWRFQEHHRPREAGVFLDLHRHDLEPQEGEFRATSQM